MEDKDLAKYEFYIDGEAGEIANFLFDNFDVYSKELSKDVLRDLQIVHKY